MVFTGGAFLSRDLENAELRARYRPLQSKNSIPSSSKTAIDLSTTILSSRSHPLSTQSPSMSKDATIKKEKKDKKRSDDGVKKEKKEKKSRKSLDVSEHVEVDEDGDVVIDESVAQIVSSDAVPTLALVPFANPLADDKNGKKVLKTVKKGKPFGICTYIPR